MYIRFLLLLFLCHPPLNRMHVLWLISCIQKEINTTVLSNGPNGKEINIRPSRKSLRVASIICIYKKIIEFCRHTQGQLSWNVWTVIHKAVIRPKHTIEFCRHTQGQLCWNVWTVIHKAVIRPKHCSLHFTYPPHPSWGIDVQQIDETYSHRCSLVSPQ